MIPSFGLYLGTTNVYLAVYKEAQPEVVANHAGDRVTPAIVAFSGGEKSVGLAAKQGISRNAKRTITHIKNFIGAGKAELEEEIKKSTCKIIHKDDLKYEIEENGKLKYYTPFDILLFIFQTMREIAKSHHHGSELYSTVIAVPLHFNSEQRAILRDAANKAGFKVLRLINEPSSAALAYQVGQETSQIISNCLVYRIGGTSLDVTVLHVSGGMYRIHSYVQRKELGGEVFTDLLAKFCAEEFRRQYRADIQDSKQSLHKLRIAAERCKHVLSTLGSAQCISESIYEGIDLNLTVSRARFESIISSKLQQCLEPIQEALQKSGLSKDNIQKVILAGGSAKVPRLQKLIGEMFPSAELLNSISPDEVLVLGAAEEAALLAGEDGVEDPGVDDYTIETLSQGIYIKMIGSDNTSRLYPVLPCHVPVPTKWEHSFSLPQGQTSSYMEVYEGPEGCEENVEKATLLCHLVLQDLPEGCNLKTIFQIKSDGSMSITCSEKSSNRVESITVTRAKES